MWISSTSPAHQLLRQRFHLTDRELDVALLVAEGLRNREVAEALAISPHTVRRHGERVFMKLGVHTRAALGARLRAELDAMASAIATESAA
jgi:DNA-binding CsgD family transcriptional regulator